MLEISSTPLDVWYEGPTFVVADKPKGMAVHPPDPQGEGSLVNALLNSNRWLAEMETSHRPGVIHALEPQDRGLVLVAKTDEMAETLRAQHQREELTFSYRVRMPASVDPVTGVPVTVVDHRVFADGTALYDIDTPWGDSARLRSAWLKDTGDDAYFALYQIAVPGPSRTMVVAWGDRMPLPDIELYTAPPCSVCNGTKDFLTRHGFWYSDHSLTEEENIATMRRLRGDERGIPVILLNGRTLVGFDQHRLKSMLSLY